MKLLALGDGVLVKVFSDNDLTNEIIVEEQIIYEPTGAEITPRYGIMVNPSSYNKNNFIGEIDINKA
jgi:hypothetical protein